MYTRNAFGALLLTMAGFTACQVAQADQGTASGTYAFPNMPGYGYEYQATWNSTAGNLTFTPFGDANGSTAYIAGNLSGFPLEVTSGAFSFEGQIQFRFIQLSTGAAGFPPIGPSSPPVVYVSTSAPFSVPAQPTEVRFSNYAFLNTVVVTGDPAIAPDGRVPSDLQTLSASFKTSFQAGNFLTASNDPSCASFSCMTPGHDLLKSTGVVSLGAFFSAVPEPDSFGLLLAGLAFTGATVSFRARRAAKPAV